MSSHMLLTTCLPLMLALCVSWLWKWMCFSHFTPGKSDFLLSEPTCGKEQLRPLLHKGFHQTYGLFLCYVQCFHYHKCIINKLTYVMMAATNILQIATSTALIVYTWRILIHSFPDITSCKKSFMMSPYASTHDDDEAMCLCRSSC